MSEPRVLDLFSGKAGWSVPYLDVVTVDNDPALEPSICADVRDLHFERGEFDVILASPPCETFSVATTSACSPSP